MKKHGWEPPDDTPVSPDAEINQNKGLLELEFKNCKLNPKLVFKVVDNGDALAIYERKSKKQFEFIKKIVGKINEIRDGMPY